VPQQRVVHELPEAGQPDFAAADMPVTVAMRIEPEPAVVKVQQVKTSQPNRTIQPAQDRGPTPGGF